jgi:hypothetical protein
MTISVGHCRIGDWYTWATEDIMYLSQSLNVVRVSASHKATYTEVNDITLCEYLQLVWKKKKDEKKREVLPGVEPGIS